MSIYNRDYMRDGPTGRGAAHPSNWSVITWLIVINAAFFVLTLLFESENSRPLTENLSLSLHGLASYKIWSFFTYQFIHSHLLHFAFNMVGLFFIGRILLQLITPRQFLEIYLAGAIVGGIAQLLFNLATQSDGLIMGASGAVMAIILALATLIPNQSLNFLLFFIIPVKMTMRQIAMIVIIMDVIGFTFSLVSSRESNEAIAHFAHFGGMLLGWSYIKFWYTRSNPSPSRRSRTRSLKERFGMKKIKKAQMNETGKTEKKGAGSDAFVSNDVDAILDKINAEGFQSLTKEEQQLLEKSSKRLSKRLDQDK